MIYDRILELMGVPGWHNLYILGVFAKRVTIYSQQVRAVNLIDAIHYYWKPLADTSICIVGGGAAGLTAAARAVETYGAKVTVLEESEMLVRMQTNSRHRWLHPTIYDWPFVEATLTSEADLPVLVWTACPANKFAETMRTAWGQIRSRHEEKVTVETNARVDSIDLESDGSIAVSWHQRVSNDGPVAKSRPFQIVILAVGFGVERQNPTRSYWEQDPLDQFVLSNPVVLIAGYGDGALTDLMRACLLAFDHQKVLNDVIQAAKKSGLAKQIREIEDDPQATDDSYLTETYRNLDAPYVRTILERAVNRNRLVILAGPGKHLFSTRASALNRLIASQLLKLKAFEHIPFGQDEHITAGGESDPIISMIQRTLGREITNTVLRLGVDSVVSKIAGNPSFPETLSNTWKEVSARCDITREPWWKSLEPVSASPETCLLLCGDYSEEGQDGVDNLILGTIDRLKQTPSLKTLPGALTRVPLSQEKCFASEDAFLDAVRALCLAPVAVFTLGKDMGRNNPGGMLLLGIRSAVRRGVTVVVHMGDLSASDWSALPFNLKEVQLLGLREGREGIDLLADAIRSGLGNMDEDASAYTDLPAFEVVRRPQRRTAAPDGHTEVFVLCPFSESYTKEYWHKLQSVLEGIVVQKRTLRLRRVIDYASPLLVGERLYELTRSVILCLVDWTAWRPNVFFELGVRLAVQSVPPVCIMSDTEARRKIDPVRRALFDLFLPLRYPKGRDDKGRQQFQGQMASELNRRTSNECPRERVYAQVERNLVVRQEYGGETFERTTLSRVDRLMPDPSKQGRLPVLHAGNEVLNRQAWRATVDALLAVRLLTTERIGLAETGSEFGEGASSLRDFLESVDDRIADLFSWRSDPEYKAVWDYVRRPRV